MSQSAEKIKTSSNPDGRLHRKIGATEYEINVWFSRTSRETVSDKIKRMLKSEVS